MKRNILKTGLDSLLFPTSGRPVIADDEQAMRDVWNAVGDDMRTALGIYEEKEAQQEENE